MKSIQLTNSTQFTTPPSDPPHQDHLSSSLASCNCSSPCCNTATLFSVAFKSFTTDHQQKWLSQPQSPRLPTPNLTATASTNHLDQDFVLFPSTADYSNTHRARRLSNSGPQRATSHTLPNQSPRSASYSPGQLSQQYHRRLSTNQLSVSPVQNLRVSGLIESSSASPLQSHNNNFKAQQHRTHTSSAPNLNTPGNSARARPPVPLFSNSTSNVPSMARTPVARPEGTSPKIASQTYASYQHSLTYDLTDIHDMEFDFSEFTTMPDDQTHMFDEPLDFSQVSSFESTNDHPASDRTSPQTISPKDMLVNDFSAPPSTTFTNLTTPGTTTYDSPIGAYSTETSPLFGDEELDGESKNWPSLFEPLEEEPQSVPMSHTISNTSSSGRQSFYNSSPALPNASPAPIMSRDSSSPGRPASKSGRHSSISGVGARKRDKPLPPITVEDPNDTIAVKRARNTMAARKSREKRLQRTEALEGQIENLQDEVEHWKKIAFDHGYTE